MQLFVGSEAFESNHVKLETSRRYSGTFTKDKWSLVEVLFQLANSGIENDGRELDHCAIGLDFRWKQDIFGRRKTAIACDPLTTTSFKILRIFCVMSTGTVQWSF